MSTRTAHAEEPVDLDQPMKLERDETPAERIDRNFNELLGELRLAKATIWGFMP